MKTIVGVYVSVDTGLGTVPGIGWQVLDEQGNKVGKPYYSRYNAKVAAGIIVPPGNPHPHGAADGV